MVLPKCMPSQQTPTKLSCQFLVKLPSHRTVGDIVTESETLHRLSCRGEMMQPITGSPWLLAQPLTHALSTSYGATIPRKKPSLFLPRYPSTLAVGRLRLSP